VILSGVLLPMLLSVGGSPPTPPVVLDAGVHASTPSEQDRQVLESLELLEHLDELKNLDILIELSRPG